MPRLDIAGRVVICPACGESHPGKVRINQPNSAHLIVVEVFKKALADPTFDVNFGNPVLFKHFIHEAKALGYFTPKPEPKAESPICVSVDCYTEGVHPPHLP